MVLKPNPSFLLKVLFSQFINQHIELDSFQTFSGIDSSAQLLCPVHALKFYVSSTAQFRQSNQLFVSFDGERWFSVEAEIVKLDSGGHYTDL